jgi:hypothetical protein
MHEKYSLTDGKDAKQKFVDGLCKILITLFGSIGLQAVTGTEYGRGAIYWIKQK